MQKNLELSSYIDCEYIQKMSNIFYELMGVKTILVDKDILKNKILVEKDAASITFCSDFVKASAEGRKRCNDCINSYVKKAFETQSICKMHCHMGLTNYAIPIKIGNELVAFILFGQALDKPHNLENAKKIAAELGINERKFIKAYKAVKVLSTENWELARRFLTMFANFISTIATESYIANQRKNRDAIIRFIIESISSSFNIKEILNIVCHELVNLFDVNRAFVFKFSKKDNTYKILMDYRNNPNVKSLDEICTKEEYAQTCNFWREEIKKRNLKNVRVVDIFSENIPQLVKEYYLNAGINTCIGSIVAEDSESSTLLVLQEYKQKREWTNHDVEFLNILTKHVSIALKQSEIYNELLQKTEIEKKLINNLPFSVWLKDKLGQYLVVNNQYCEFNNFNSPEDVIGKTDYELYPLALAEKYKEEDDFVYSFNDSFRVEQFTELHDQKKWYEALKVPILSNDGDFYGTIGYFRDITEHKEIDEIKNVFISTVNHQLRTPLTSMMGGLNVIMNGLTGQVSDKTYDMLNIVLNNSEKLLNLLNDVLDIENLSSDKTRFKYKEYNVVSVMDEVLDEYEDAAKKNKLEFVKNYEVENIDACVDRMRLRQIFISLIDNAVKFSKPIDDKNSGKIIIKISNDEDKNIISTKITNFGTEIPKDQIGDVFKKFYQVDTSNSKKTGGTGLGLALAKAIISKLKGKIEVESGNNKTSFTVLLSNKACKLNIND